MRNIIVLLVIGLAGYGTWLWWQERSQPQKPAVASAPAEAPAATPASPAAKVEQQPVATPAPSVSVSQAPEKNFAPDGVFFVMQQTSITTESGIVGVRPGTQVKLVKDNGASLRVSDGKQEFDVARASVTNDLEVVGRFHKAQAQQQAALAQARSSMAQNSPPPAPVPEASVNSQEEANKKIARTALAGRLDALVRVETTLRTQINDASREAAREDDARRNGRSFSKGALSQQLPALLSRLQVNQEQQERIRNDLAK